MMTIQAKQPRSLYQLPDGRPEGHSSMQQQNGNEATRTVGEQRPTAQSVHSAPGAGGTDAATAIHSTAAGSTIDHLAAPVVQFRGVTKKIGSKTIIDNLTLDVPAGCVFGFLGPNGSGKTTTIRMLVGLMSPTSGDIRIEGQSIRTHFEQAISKVGAIVENPEMYKYMTGYQNLMHYARMSPGVTKERIAEVVDFVGLGGRVRDRVSTYSLGMRQRLGVAQALLHRPRLLVLDEPTNGLDPQGIRELRDYLRALSREQGTTVFVSSHLLSEMELMCDTVAVINGGRLVDVRHLHGQTTGSGASATEELITVRFDTDQPEQVHALIPGSYVEGTSCVARATRSDIARLNAQLVQQGIAVYGIVPMRQTLEDQFLAMTREGGVRYD